MRIRYETTIATLIQLIIGTFLAFITGAASIFNGCRGSGGADCVSNAFVSLLLILIVIGIYGFILALGYVTQERRSKNLALALIATEAVAALIFLFDARHATSILDKGINFVSLAVCLWVIYVAWNLSRANGARIVKSARKHRA